MDKITRIHIAKVPYEIGVDAESELKKYLDAIRSKLDDDLADEILLDIEFRITEILSDRNVHRNDVITSKDIAAIQQQLGEPAQFNDDETGSKDASQDKESKRLLRDTDGAIIAGVSSGIGAYFSIDPIFIRILFIILTFASGLGILLYILLWILVPPAKTNSEKLLMRGQPVTAAALQHYRSTAQHTIANLRIRAVLMVVCQIFKVVFTVTLALMVLVLLSAIGFASAILYTKPLHKIYIAYHVNYLLLGLSWLFTMTIIGLIIVLLLRLWRRRAYSLKIAFVALVSTLILTMAGIAIITPFIVSHYRDLYGGNNLETALPVQEDTPSIAPTSLNLSAGSNLEVSYIAGSQPLHATYKAYPGMNQPNITIVDAGGSITIRANGLTQVVPGCVLNWCHGLYLPIRITVYGPALQEFTANGPTELDISNVNQSNITLIGENNANMSIANSYSANIALSAQSGSSIDASDETSQAATMTVENGAFVFGPASDAVSVNLPGSCNSQLVDLAQTPTSITVNGQPEPIQTFSQNDCVSLDDSAPYNNFVYKKFEVVPPAQPSRPSL